MSDRFCGFDLDRVAALQRAVGEAAEPARTLSRHIGSTSDTAMELIARASGISVHNLGVEPSMDTDPDRLGLRTITMHAPDVSAEIGRRLAHLKACEKLQHDGFRINPAAVFDDEPPPDEGKIRTAVQQLRDALSQGDLDTVLAALAEADGAITGLNRAETEAFFGALNSADLQKWNLLLSLHVFGLGLSNDSRIALANTLLSKLSASSVRSLLASMPALEPSLADEDHGHATYAWPEAALYGNPSSIEDINQGQLGDCWFLASLAAEVERDPTFLRTHLRDNGNGSYTVTLYRDGKPVPVTVSGALPTDNGGAGLPFVHGDPSWGTDGPLWPAIYEKAYAQLAGSYKDADHGGYGSDGMSLLTGKKSERLSPDVVPLSDIDAQLQAGHPVTAGTDSHHSGFLWLHEDEYFDGGKLVTLHEYTVQSVDLKAHTVTLRNPWGSNSAAPEYVTLSEDEFRSHFTEVSLGGQ